MNTSKSSNVKSTGSPRNAGISKNTAAGIIITALLCCILLGWYFLSGPAELAPGVAKAAKMGTTGGPQQGVLSEDDGATPATNSAVGSAPMQAAPAGGPGNAAPPGNAGAPINYSVPGNSGGGSATESPQPVQTDGTSAPTNSGGYGGEGNGKPRIKSLGGRGGE